MKKKYIAPQIIISHLHTEGFLAASNNINIFENEHADGGFVELSLKSESVWNNDGW